MDYTKIRNGSDDRNDCTVIATAIVCGIAYSKAQSLLADAGRIKGRGCLPSIYQKVIRDQGFSIQDIHPQFKAKTIRTLERELAESWGGCKVLIGIRRHVLAWDGAKIQDWTGGRIHRIRDIFLICPFNDVPELGRSVPVPKRHKLNRTPQKRSAVMANILGNEPQRYQSVAAAYTGMGLDLRGHQKIRRLVKYHGEWVFSAWRQNSDRVWNSVHVTIRLVE